MDSDVRWDKISDPDGQFSGWEFVVKKAHWSAFGVQLREFAKNKQKYLSYAVSSPRSFAFEEGDVFWHSSGLEHLKVVYASTPLEVKHGICGGRSVGYHITEKQFAGWLKSGVKPDVKYSIDRNQSRSEIARFHEYSA